MTLYPFQADAVAAIKAQFAAGHRSTLLVLATGLGKTTVAAELARDRTTYGQRTLLLAPREEIVDQIADRVRSMGVWVGIEQGKRRSSGEPVVVATVQTMQGRRLQSFAPDAFDFLVADECHHAPAKSWQTTVGHFPYAHLLGVTATPCRADGQALGDTFETVAYRYDLREAIRDEWLAPLTARRVVVDGIDLSGVRARAGDLAQDELAALMSAERAVQGVVSPLLDLAGDRKTMVFAVDVAHAYALSAAIRTHRPGASRVAHGEMPTTERARLLADFRAGEFQFLVNCALYTEGFDLPALSCIAMVRPTKSLGLFMQCLGRGTRRAPGKADCLLLDFTGAAGRHRLVGPADCLAGHDVDLADDVRAEIDRLLGVAQLPLDEVLTIAEIEAERRRIELTGAAVVRYHADTIDPFIGADHTSAPASVAGEAYDRPTPGQLASLKEAGVTVSKLPRAFTSQDASRLLGRFATRRATGLCSYAQAKRLSQFGIADTRRLTFARATELTLICISQGWKPWSLERQPEHKRQFRASAARGAA